MRAAVVMTPGGPFQEMILERPRPKAGEVLVRIAASGVNPLDAKIRAGIAAHARHALPAVLGLDLAGWVEAVGEGVTAFRVGDEVFGMTGGVAGIQGSLAEFAAVDADLLAHKPPSLSMREAAAVPLVAITAWEGLVDRAAINFGDQVLIHGGAGGVGHLAVQIAKAFDAKVFATGRASQLAAIARMGATPIDFEVASLDEYVQAHTDGEGFDIVYDTVGGTTLDDSFKATRTYGGHVVSCLGWGNHSLAPLSFRAATYSGVFTLLPLLSGNRRANHGKILARVGAMVERGQVRPMVNATKFTLDSVHDAHAALTKKDQLGKIIVEIAN